MPHLSFRHLFAAGLSIGSFVEAINANTMVALGAALASMLTTVWGAYRRERKADFDQAEYEKLLKAVVEAKVKAVNAGEPEPWPHITIPGLASPGPKEGP